MKKLILTILTGLSLTGICEANSLKDVNISFVDNIDESCTVENSRGCYIPEYKQIYVRKNDNNIPFVLFHEICHHLERNFQEYTGVDEEYECNVFGLWAIGYDISEESQQIKNKITKLISTIK